LRSSRLVLVLLLASLAGAASAQSNKLQLGGYEQTLKLMEQGKCNEARDKLMPNGRPRTGEEMEINDLGNCYIRAAKKISDPEDAERSRETGVGWILFAANAGQREAAQDLVRLYLNGPVFFRDPYEAGKWYLLWEANHSQIRLGQIEFDRDLQKQVNALSPEEWAEARARLAKWKPTLISAE